MALPLSYNLRNIARRPASVAATAIGIALVVAVLIGALALASGFQAALRETGSPDNVLVLRTGADTELSSGIGRDAANIIRSSPFVASGPDGRPLATTDYYVVINLSRKGGSGGTSNVVVRGMDPSALGVRPAFHIVEGRMFTPGSDEMVVARRISGRFHGASIGDRLQIGQQNFTVVGLFQANGTAYDSEIWGDQAVVGPASGRGAYQSVTFRMRDPSKFAEIKRQLESDPRLHVEAHRENVWYSEQSRLLAQVIRVAGVFITLIMAVGAMFGAMNTMDAAVGARTREIAVLLTLGFSPLAVMASFVTESVLISLIGGVLGCLLSLPINGITTSTTNWSSFSEVAFAFRVTPPAMLVGLVFAAIMGLVGGFLPALHAARQPVAKSLREL